jgi:hypothetical protein
MKSALFRACVLCLGQWLYWLLPKCAWQVATVCSGSRLCDKACRLARQGALCQTARCSLSERLAASLQPVPRPAAASSVLIINSLELPDGVCCSELIGNTTKFCRHAACHRSDGHEPELMAGMPAAAAAAVTVGL